MVENKPTVILICMALAVIVLFFFVMTVEYYDYDMVATPGFMSAVYAQQQQGQEASNQTTTSGQTNPVAGGGGGGGVSSTDALVGAVGTSLAGGVIAAWTDRKKKDSKIDAALKNKDRLLDNLFDNQWMIVNRAMDPANAQKPFREIILQKAFPVNNLDQRTIADVINQDRNSFKEWYKQRYMENPD